jgi:hypothetical protein
VCRLPLLQVSEQAALSKVAGLEQRIASLKEVVMGLRAELGASRTQLATQLAVNRQLMARKEQVEWQLLAAMAESGVVGGVAAGADETLMSSTGSGAQPGPLRVRQRAEAQLDGRDGDKGMGAAGRGSNDSKGCTAMGVTAPPASPVPEAAASPQADSATHDQGAADSTTSAAASLTATTGVLAASIAMTQGGRKPERSNERSCTEPVVRLAAEYYSPRRGRDDGGAVPQPPLPGTLPTAALLVAPQQHVEQGVQVGLPPDHPPPWARMPDPSVMPPPTDLASRGGMLPSALEFTVGEDGRVRQLTTELEACSEACCKPSQPGVPAQPQTVPLPGKHHSASMADSDNPFLQVIRPGQKDQYELSQGDAQRVSSGQAGKLEHRTVEIARLAAHLVVEGRAMELGERSLAAEGIAGVSSGFNFSPRGAAVHGEGTAVSVDTLVRSPAGPHAKAAAASGLGAPLPVYHPAMHPALQVGSSVAVALDSDSRTPARRVTASMMTTPASSRRRSDTAPSHGTKGA